MSIATEWASFQSDLKLGELRPFHIRTNHIVAITGPKGVHLARSIRLGSLWHDDPEDDVDEREGKEACQEYENDIEQPDKGGIHAPLLGHTPADTSDELVVD